MTIDEIRKLPVMDDHEFALIGQEAIDTLLALVDEADAILSYKHRAEKHPDHDCPTCQWLRRVKP